MRTKQHELPNNLKSPGSNLQHINGSSEIKNPISGIESKMDTSKEMLLLRLSEMEEINDQLVNLLDESRKKLSDRIILNAKFLSIVAHDLRNPFNSIIGILDLLAENMEDYNKAELEKLIHIASNSAVRTLELLDNLLKWSVSQNTESNFNPVKINLRELVINEFESFNTSATLKQITMGHSIGHNTLVTADIQMVQTIFRNLISNAIKYSNSGGEIYVSATEGNQFVEIEVKDNGIGISENTKRKLFKTDEFHSTLGTDNEHGTGLGLLFCREFIEMHGGKIWVESEPGKGSKFKFTLPRYI
ncbi:MAG TPA: hypothetical protein DCR40_07470 [Prolixibacteraceae bacterium]|nr:hypothetical protein [Prolixibacteraceae bacterium]